MALGHWDSLTLWSLGPFDCTRGKPFRPRRLQNLQDFRRRFLLLENSNRIKADSKRYSLRLEKRGQVHLWYDPSLARAPRSVVGNVVYHILNRATGRMRIFRKQEA